MTLLERDLAAAEQRLDVTLPASFRRFATTEALDDVIAAEVLHPSRWWRVRNDDTYRGPPGIVFAVGAGGAYWLLAAAEEAPRLLQPALHVWDFHEGPLPKRVARSVDELPAVLEQRADALLVAVNEDGG